ncbi:unnamed protein product [Alopecurus aequalis]
MSRRRRRTTPALPPPLEDEDLLREILLRLPPQPSSLPRASLVCKLWRNIMSDPQFLERFRKHHRKPPLIGFFTGDYFSTNPLFAPILDPPDRINSIHFAMPRSSSTNRSWNFMDCRHGLAVLINKSRRETMVCDPLTGQKHHTKFPRRLNNPRLKYSWHATVLCVDDEDGHVHGDCFSSPFKLVLICIGYMQSCACVYDSASGVWGNVVSTPYMLCSKRLSVLVGNALYWLLSRGDVLAFDFERQCFHVIEKPAAAKTTNYRSVQPLRTEDGRLGLALLSGLTIKLWERKSNGDGVVGWVLLHKVIPIERVFPIIPHEGMYPWRMPSYDKRFLLVGYDEATNVIVLSTMIGNFMVQLDSMQIRHIIKRNHMCYDTFYPYINFYIAGREVGWKWMDLKL